MLHLIQCEWLFLKPIASDFFVHFLNIMSEQDAAEEGQPEPSFLLELLLELLPFVSFKNKTKQKH